MRFTVSGRADEGTVLPFARVRGSYAVDHCVQMLSERQGLVAGQTGHAVVERGRLFELLGDSGQHCVRGGAVLARRAHVTLRAVGTKYCPVPPRTVWVGPLWANPAATER